LISINFYGHLSYQPTSLKKLLSKQTAMLLAVWLNASMAQIKATDVQLYGMPSENGVLSLW
jgi:hypothetical protein